ncbi:hypothetical protein PFICI_02337 [Pestalotiopsis fici W106-1]|uniref:AGC-kinase C-terminal domain-containing protein n=1 Tax=Pestalotiopsis fici (strain W106-1 / CGMCC3.15140) TaxID=1229662 RepID=W3XFX3_PESFW|nr:uncharacterized protein PFICI_02337 [Pestalotiopsis fici W106-1]ETS84312.1 hypothetical protein PFICI_02337 [Pestalotiopsis fici W106-1]
MAPVLFQKKSKLSLREKPITVIINEHGYPKHTRSMSTTSTASTSSSTTSHGHKLHTYDPLSLHPPLSLNTSPVIDEEYDEERRQSAEQSQLQHQQHQQVCSSYDDLDSPLDYYFNSDDRRRSYIYDQQSQWPLKDWQTVPSAMDNSSDEEDVTRRAMPRTTSSSSTVSQRRPQKQFTGPLDEFVKRGEWKRRGIVFGMDAEAVEDESQHFEVNPFEFSH